MAAIPNVGLLREPNINQQNERVSNTKKIAIKILVALVVVAVASTFYLILPASAIVNAMLIGLVFGSISVLLCGPNGVTPGMQAAIAACQNHLLN